MSATSNKRAVRPKRSFVLSYSDGYWLWFENRKMKRDRSRITGKYLFFSKNLGLLQQIAKVELTQQGFPLAKTNSTLLRGREEHVLCLYYFDDSRKWELRERYPESAELRYRFWKSDEDTISGKYSARFLLELPRSLRRRFSSRGGRARP